MATYPDDELDVGLSWSAAKELEGTGDIHGTDLIVMLILSGITGAKEIKHAVQLLLLDCLDLDGLEDLGGTGLQLFHFFVFYVIQIKY